LHSTNSKCTPGNGVLLQEEDANRKGEGEGWEGRIVETLSIALKEKLKPECWLPLKMVHRNASGTSISSNCVATPMRC
jgi:hypothetical protein